ncbi:MAG TPA: tetratricopeptide repeat protein [Abditibacteriaceae bacterium]|jgi:Flp pilus assembly protein TadD
MNQIFRGITLATLAAFVSISSSAFAAPKKVTKKHTPKRAVKYGKKVTRKATPRKATARKATPPKKMAVRPAPGSTTSRSVAPPSRATRPTDKYSSLAHQRAVGLVKQAADAYARGDYRNAILLSKAASDAYPTYARAQTWLGASYHRMGRHDEARSAYKWAIALAPGTADAERAERGLREIGY